MEGFRSLKVLISGLGSRSGFLRIKFIDMSIPYAITKYISRSIIRLIGMDGELSVSLNPSFRKVRGYPISIFTSTFPARILPNGNWMIEITITMAKIIPKIMFNLFVGVN